MVCSHFIERLFSRIVSDSLKPRSSRDNNRWCPTSRRNLQDWEINDFLNLLETPGESSMIVEVPAEFLGGKTKEWITQIRRVTTTGALQMASLRIGFGNMFGELGSLSKSCFTWTALREACLTRDNLRRKGIILINRRLMCKQQLTYGICSTLYLRSNR